MTFAAQNISLSQWSQTIKSLRRSADEKNDNFYSGPYHIQRTAEMLSHFSDCMAKHLQLTSALFMAECTDLLSYLLTY